MLFYIYSSLQEYSLTQKQNKNHENAKLLNCNNAQLSIHCVRSTNTKLKIQNYNLIKRCISIEYYDTKTKIKVQNYYWIILWIILCLTIFNTTVWKIVNVLIISSDQKHLSSKCVEDCYDYTLQSHSCVFPQLAKGTAFVLHPLLLWH
jgi:hypothetical protein